MPPQKKPGKQVYQLKVTLGDVKPPIWRRIQVTGDITLFTLHEILQTVMDWTDSHLHEFEIRGESYGDREIMEEDNILDEYGETLSGLINDEQEEFVYRYDLGDCWDHEILVEKIFPAKKGVRYPVCLEGKRATPPEDCGGAPGYEELLRILGDPAHPEHDRLFAWLPGDLDPEKFDVEEANKRLRPSGAGSKNSRAKARDRS
jgi:hypothetical protein